MTFKLTLATAALALFATAGSALADPGVTTGTVNLREGPGTDYDVLYSLKKGKSLDIVDCEGSWCEVEVNGDDGYVSASFLALIGDDEDDEDEDYEEDTGPSVQLCLGSGGFGWGGYGYGKFCVED